MMRVLIILALLCAATVVAANTEVSSKSKLASQTENAARLPAGNTAGSELNTVTVKDVMEPVDERVDPATEENDEENRSADSDLQTVERAKKPGHPRRRPRYGVRNRKIRKVKAEIRKLLKALRKTRNPYRRKRIIKKIQKLQKLLRKLQKPRPNKPKPGYPNPPTKTCRCRVVAKPAKECYSFRNSRPTKKRVRPCKLRTCDAKWECLTSGWSRNVCIQKFARERITPIPGTYKCRLVRHRPKEYWAFYRKLPRKFIKPHALPKKVPAARRA